VTAVGQPMPRGSVTSPNVGSMSVGPASGAPAGVTPAGAPARAERLETLGVIARLFERLEAEGISYCHWKSNEHLGPSLLALTDLDVLVDRAAAVPLAALLAGLGFKRFAALPGRGYPGIEDYVGFDRETGRLTHLHLHWQLTLGEAYLKGYRFPWERAMLSTRVWDGASRVYVADPHLELLLLLVRSAMKLRARDRLRLAPAARYLRGGQLCELRWLADRAESSRLVQVATPLVGARAARLLPDMLRPGGPTVRDLRELRRLADPAWRTYRTYDAPEAHVRRWLRELPARVRALAARVSRSSVRPSPRVLPHGGLLVALVGPDGAGKSTVSREIARWLSREMTVVAIYGGSGSGRISWARAAAQWLHRRVPVARRAPAGGRGAATAVVAEPHGPRALARAGWALLLAAERLRTVTRARRARDLGSAVIADRFPQTQFPGINDGPRLAHWVDAPSALLARAARSERDTYATMERTSPDLVVKLTLPAEVALQRKPDTPPAQLRRKLEIVRLLRYPPATRVVEVDATLPLEQVLLRVKRAVWEAV
jgi:thymidylate kinase